MANNQLIYVIDEAVASIRKNQHQDNSWIGFGADYYAISKDGKVSKSVSSSVFIDAEWGLVQVFYAYRTNRGYNGNNGYQYYYDSGIQNLFVCPNGNIETSAVKLGNWQISIERTVNDEMRVHVLSVELGYGFDCKGQTLTEQLEYLMSLHALIDGCKTKEAVDHVLMLFNKNKNITKEDLLDTLVKENRQLKEKLEKIKVLLEA